MHKHSRKDELLKFNERSFPKPKWDLRKLITVWEVLQVKNQFNFSKIDKIRLKRDKRIVRMKVMSTERASLFCIVLFYISSQDKKEFQNPELNFIGENKDLF